VANTTDDKPRKNPGYHQTIYLARALKGENRSLAKRQRRSLTAQASIFIEDGLARLCCRPTEVEPDGDQVPPVVA